MNSLASLLADSDSTIRLLNRREDGTIWDARRDCSQREFAGVFPSIGDQILSRSGRNELRNRRLLTVVGRVFNPREKQDYVALIVGECVPTEAERVLMG